MADKRIFELDTLTNITSSHYLVIDNGITTSRIQATTLIPTNTKTVTGMVTAPNGGVNKVWKTDASGNPGWSDASGINTLNTTKKFYLTGTPTATTNTDTLIFDTGVYVSANAGELVATKFVGPLQGNATSATTATTATNATNATNSTNATNIYSSASTTRAYVLGTTIATSANHATVYNASVYTENSILHGAAWNDYAEFRKSDVTEPGRVIVENGDGTLSLSTKRLQRGAEIISNTYGFAIGKTDDCRTPIAVSGRVLAYYDGDLADYKPGMPVCSGPNGTVSVMTEKEEAKYPSRIIGTVSEIPTYETWGENSVPVDGRIWIRVR